MDDLTQALAYIDLKEPLIGWSDDAMTDMRLILDAARRWDWLTIPCTTCSGRGYYKTGLTPDGQSYPNETCETCGGRGWTINPQATELVLSVVWKPIDKERAKVEAGLIVLVETAEDKLGDTK